MAYGLRPISHGGYNYNTGGFEEYPIDPSYATQIFHGDIVRLVDDYGVIRSTNSEVPTPLKLTNVPAVTIPTFQALGIFVGCRYTDTNSTPTWAQRYPGSGTNAFAFVVTDPNAVFMIASDDEWAEADLGNTVNPVIIANATPGGDTVTGNSDTKVALNTDVADAALRIVGVHRDGSTITGTDDTCDLIVRWSSPSCTLFGSPISEPIA